ncbi:MAG: EAL domain-containing protein [Novosphingobium sp.]
MTERRQPAAKPRIVRRLADLQSALAGDEIEVLFQPQVELATGKPMGVEALARWQHPDLGELGPQALFDIASRSGTIAQLSRHIQDRALALAANWTSPLDQLRLSVNVTSQDIAEQRFATEKLERLRSTGFPAERLTLEITEAGLVADLTRAAQVLQGLREQGLRIAIDDFGTGYSSLAYLKALPVDILKLDRAFTQDVTGCPKARIIVGSVIAMARDLGLTVVAEGVETEEQRALLAEQGVTLCQGFLFAPALSSVALASWIAN